MAHDTNGDGLRPITVGLPPDVLESLRDMSRRYLLSQSEIMRILVMRNLGKHLGDARIIDKGDAAEIRRQIRELFDAVSRTEDELHGIGVWYGQEVKMMDIRAKYGDTAVPAGTGNGGIAFPGQEIDGIISRYEEAVKQAGDALCRLLMWRGLPTARRPSPN